RSNLHGWDLVHGAIVTPRRPIVCSPFHNESPRSRTKDSTSTSVVIADDTNVVQRVWEVPLERRSRPTRFKQVTMASAERRCPRVPGVPRFLYFTSFRSILSLSTETLGTPREHIHAFQSYGGEWRP